jgi:hypothetical protein
MVTRTRLSATFIRTLLVSVYNLDSSTQQVLEDTFETFYPLILLWMSVIFQMFVD